MGPHELSFVNAYAPAETLRNASVFLDLNVACTWEIVRQERSGNEAAGLTVRFEAIANQER